MTARRLAMVTPWPPRRNGIADYAFELARHMEDLLVVTASGDGVAARPTQRVVLPRMLLARQEWREAAMLYQVGNNADHAFLVPLFLRRPGVVVLHDLSLHYLAELVDEILPGFLAAQLGGERPAVAARFARLAAAGLARAIDFREIRLLAWLRHAPALVVHSRAAQRIVQRLLPDSRIEVVPHFCFLRGPGLPALAAWRDAIRDEARRRWLDGVSFSGPAFIVVALGFPSADKQLASVIGAVARLPPVHRGQVALLIGGEARPGDPDPLAIAARLGCRDRVRMLGWLDEPDADRLLLFGDLVMALRFPTGGESSGVVARALGLGCAAVVSDHGGYGELPDEAVIKLPARHEPTELVRALLIELIDDRSRIVRTRAAAYAFAVAAGDAAAAAARLTAIAVEAAG